MLTVSGFSDGPLSPILQTIVCMCIYIHVLLTVIWDLRQGLWAQGLPLCSVGEESACDARDPGSIPGSGRCPGGGNGNPLQYSCLENLMDRGAWQATVHGVTRVGHDLATKSPPYSGSILNPDSFSNVTFLIYYKLFIVIFIQ